MHRGYEIYHTNFTSYFNLKPKNIEYRGLSVHFFVASKDADGFEGRLRTSRRNSAKPRNVQMEWIEDAAHDLVCLLLIFSLQPDKF